VIGPLRLARPDLGQARRAPLDLAASLHVIRQAIYAVGKGGVVSVPGVYAGTIDTFPMGIVVNKGLTIRSGQTHVHKHVPKLLAMKRLMAEPERYGLDFASIPNEPYFAVIDTGSPAVFA